MREPRVSIKSNWRDWWRAMAAAVRVPPPTVEKKFFPSRFRCERSRESLAASVSVTSAAQTLGSVPEIPQRRDETSITNTQSGAKVSRAKKTLKRDRGGHSRQHICGSRGIITTTTTTRARKKKTALTWTLPQHDDEQDQLTLVCLFSHLPSLSLSARASSSLRSRPRVPLSNCPSYSHESERENEREEKKQNKRETGRRENDCTQHTTQTHSDTHTTTTNTIILSKSNQI